MNGKAGPTRKHTNAVVCPKGNPRQGQEMCGGRGVRGRYVGHNVWGNELQQETACVVSNPREEEGRNKQMWGNKGVGVKVVCVRWGNPGPNAEPCVQKMCARGNVCKCVVGRKARGVQQCVCVQAMGKVCGVCVNGV